MTGQSARNLDHVAPARGVILGAAAFALAGALTAGQASAQPGHPPDWENQHHDACPRHTHWVDGHWDRDHHWVHGFCKRD